MNISVIEAEGRLEELVGRAQAGEEVVLTLNGKPAVRLGPAFPPIDLDQRRERLLELSARMAQKAVPGADAAHCSNFLFDEFGLPG
jgi:prevent-host-death family protein